MSDTQTSPAAGGAAAPRTAPESPPGTALTDDDLELLLLIRHFELSLLGLFSEGKLNGTTHTCLGQEHVPVALAPLLDERDHVFSNHRGHGHYLARFRDPEGLLAEIMGREGAVCQGVGGSQHILRGRYLSTGVQGESLPVAVGVGLHLKEHEPGRAAVVHIGDGTWGEGSVYEALNMAQLWQVPVVVVVEHNGIAQSTPAEMQMAGSIEGRAAGFGVAYRSADAWDVDTLRATAGPAVEEVRATGRPLVLELSVPRIGPHSKGDDTRSEAELAAARARDWHARYEQLFPERFARAEDRMREQVARVVRDVDARPLSEWRDPCLAPSA
ncbi:thiamine pyrophosphate-dependent dehydrogenase E1 component subunit alpha [Streptomyces bathyalis]|uniref:Thiamine pyrophosphate-dependent dehydrogenase E1 component subunit alpha n=1 Tax=Streptomyces bathyalis TaxID=2710756 RepID=A0A7T1T9U0_9ACTN|nr:thiamine pyrophosphate-dependent dehydrogenase E1 component subunit alpha [Streptomyces bathyalis]QPP08954.1 thiamine pyrophosphate-dependent dehydrogenase E1 component subunit alpha [Streptomyces bathyalis]